MHPLDQPVWNALITGHAALAEGGPLARRYPPAILPFAAMAEMSAEAFAALHALMGRSDHVVMFTPEPVTAPVQFKTVLEKRGEQMIGLPAEPARPAAEIIMLGKDDVPAMMALTTLTKPGPFTPRTHELGSFLGIRIDGRLVAMTGERIKPENYTELTAVCVHPDYRGRGYAQTLLAAVARGIAARGGLPFLHVFADNDSAIALYRRQGMQIRRRVHITVLARSD